MSDIPSRYERYKCGADAVRWLREYLNAGVRLSALVLEEQSQIRLRLHRDTEGAGDVSFYDHQADVCLLGAEFLRIDFDGPYFGTVSSAVFDEGDSTRLEISLAAGGFSIEFDAVQVSEQMVPCYIMKSSTR